MNEEQFIRSETIWGGGALRILSAKRVAVFGVGGVGGALAETLARSGLGFVTLVDGDVVEITNLNRQAAALHSTLGRPKAEVMRERMLDISPEMTVEAVRLFYLPETADNIDLTAFDYVADAVDTVTAKLEIVCRCLAAGIPVVSCMGTGNKRDPLRFRITDIAESRVCPLAKAMRRELRKRGIESGVKALWSDEEPAQSGRTPGSLPFVPPVAGMLLAREIVFDLLREG